MQTADTLAYNPQSLNALRYQAGQQGGKEATRAAAQQFESYFLQLMLRSMRETLSDDGLFNSRESRIFTDMFDQQTAQNIARGQGMGIADMLVDYIESSVQASQGIKPAPRPYTLPPVSQAHDVPVAGPAVAAAAAESAVEGVSADAAGEPLTPKNFVNTLWPHAVEAAAELGVSPHFLLAQAALETGWGKSELKHADGSNSFNLFNIKAGKGWDGARVAAETTEYARGVAAKETAQFRAYGSYSEAFADYANLLKSNARYAGVVGLGGDAQAFARGLQQSGYATDPMYADKILRVMGSQAFRDGLTGQVLS